MKNEDVNLIQRILSGDEDACAALVERHREWVHSLAWREIGDFHAAQEITQDTFIQAFKSLPTLRDSSRFLGWLYMIAKRQCIEWLRRKPMTMQSLDAMPKSELEQLYYTQYLEEEQVQASTDTLREVVERLLQKLPETERSVMVLHYFNGLTCEEVGEHLDVSLNTVKSRLYRARKRLEQEARAIHSSADQQIEQIWEEVDREERQFLANSPLEGEPRKFNLDVPQSNSFSSKGHLSRRYGMDMKLGTQSDPLVPHVQKYHATMGALYIRSAEQIALVRKQTLDSTSLRQSIRHERLMKLSPASLYTFTAAAWAGTDLECMFDFVQAVQGYQRTIVDYFHDKDAFGSRKWFASDRGAVDWWDLPQFHFDRTDVSENATRALPELFLLLLINLVLFTGTFLIFTKIEV